MSTQCYYLLLETVEGEHPEPPIGPMTRDEALAKVYDHLAWLSSRVRVWPPPVAAIAPIDHYRILLDTGQMDFTSLDEFYQLYDTDPLIHTIFQMGYRQGQLAAEDNE